MAGRGIKWIGEIANMYGRKWKANIAMKSLLRFVVINAAAQVKEIIKPVKCFGLQHEGGGE